MTLFSLIILAVNCVFAENIVLVHLLGVSPFLAVSGKRKSSLHMGIIVSVIMIVSTILSYLIDRLILVPFNAEFLRTLLFVLLIIALIYFFEILLKRFASLLYRYFRIYLPLITANCALLAVVLNNVLGGLNFLESIAYAVFSGLGFTFATWMFACVRERVEYCDIPKSFAGIPIALITAALLSMALMGFNGFSL